MQANAIGAAYIAFVGLQMFDFADVARQTKYRADFSPDGSNHAVYDDAFATFKELHQRLAPLYRRLNQEKQS